MRYDTREETRRIPSRFRAETIRGKKGADDGDCCRGDEEHLENRGAAPQHQAGQDY